MAEADRGAIPKLKLGNYSIWKTLMRFTLDKEDCWNVIVDAPPEPVTDKWLARDKKAKALISLCLDTKHVLMIEDCTSAREMWTLFKDHHEKQTANAQIRCIRQLTNLKLAEGGDMEDHLLQCNALMKTMAGSGLTVSDNFKIGIYLGSLPRSYETIVMTLEMNAGTDTKAEAVYDKLLEEYHRRKDQGTSTTHGDVLYTQHQKGGEKKGPGYTPDKGKGPECFFCKRRGHLKRDCKKFKAWKKQQGGQQGSAQHQSTGDGTCHLVSTEYHVCLNSTGGKDGSWCIDSGATAHMCNQRELFDHLEHASHGQVITADGNALQVQGKGTCSLRQVDNHGKCSTFVLVEVLFVPGLAGKLLSVSKLIDSGIQVAFSINECILQSKAGQATGYRQGNLYMIPCIDAALSISYVPRKRCVHEWHRVLGHRNLRDVRRETDIHIEPCECNDTCEVCLYGKQIRKTVPQTAAPASIAPLDLIHSDVCGPMEINSVGGKRYILTLIDDYTGFTTVMLLSRKDETAECVKAFVKQMQVQRGKTVKIFRTDCGGEYVNTELQRFFTAEGIIHQTTNPYTPEQNGRAERKNRTLIEMTRCMLKDAQMGKEYWAEAVISANHVLNSVNDQKKGLSPCELWTGKKPTLQNLLTFGERVHVLVPSEKRKKLDDRSIQGIYLRAADNTKGYRILDPQTNRIIISQNVIPVGCGGQWQEAADSRNRELEQDAYTKIPFASSQSFEGSDRQSESSRDSWTTDSDETDSSDSETTIIIEPQNTESTCLRRSTRVRRAPERYANQAHRAEGGEQDPTTLQEALNSNNCKAWQKAMQDELQSLDAMGTWELVKRPKDCHVIQNKWVYKTKRNQHGDIVRRKARLVAKGFSQKYGRDYDEVFAPVAKQATIRTLFAVAAQRGMLVKHYDVETAFLNGTVRHDLFMEPPTTTLKVSGLSNMVYKLKKGLYGLKQGAHEWNRMLDDTLREIGFQPSQNDPCLYVKVKESGKIYLCVHVDDFAVAATSKEEFTQFETDLGKHFTIQDLGEIKHFLGLQIERASDGGFLLHQGKYIQEKLMEFQLQDAKVSSIPMDTGYFKASAGSEGEMVDQEKYRSAIGSLLFLCNNTRPDISAATTILAQKVSKPTVTDWTEVKRVFTYLKGTMHLGLHIRARDDGTNLTAYADADWANDPTDRESNTGFCIILGGTLLHWGCHKQNLVTTSTTAAEYVALCEVAQETLWFKKLLRDFDVKVDIPIIHEDNQSCIKIASDRGSENRTKHLDVKVHYVRDLIQQGHIKIVYQPTDKMLADLFTKPLPKVKVQRLRNALGLIQV